MPAFAPAGPPTALSGLEVAGVPTMGMGGFPAYTGNWFFVNETSGSDGNTGAADSPLATLGRAKALASANNNDVVAFWGTIHLTSTLVWDKSQVHLIGMCDPIRRGKRARISVSGSTAFTPMVEVTASGCHFRNFGTFYGFNSASNNAICWAEEGGRNCYDNIEFMGFGDGTASTGTANITGARALTVGLASSGNGENSFYGCVLGVDTTQRNATNYTLELLGDTPRNYFENCTFEAFLGSSGTGSSHIYGAASACIDRYTKFVGCEFLNAIESTGSTMAQCVNLAAAAGGFLLFDQCTMVGITHLETTPTNQCFINMSLPSATSGGLAINNT